MCVTDCGRSENLPAYGFASNKDASIGRSTRCTPSQRACEAEVLRNDAPHEACLCACVRTCVWERGSSFATARLWRTMAPNLRHKSCQHTYAQKRWPVSSWTHICNMQLVLRTTHPPKQRPVTAKYVHFVAVAGMWPRRDKGRGQAASTAAMRPESVRDTTGMFDNDDVSFKGAS